jgi:hypothetical protein
MTSSQAERVLDSIRRLHSLIHESVLLVDELELANALPYLPPSSPSNDLGILLCRLESQLERMIAKTTRSLPQ